MYQNLPFSKNTRLVNSILSSDTVITVEDPTVFPPAPNFATIGTDENAETIFYNAISSNELQNVERAKEGTAKSWGAGEIISRNFSNVDVVAFANNISKIAIFLNNHGNLFEYRKVSTNYNIGKLVQIPNIDDYIYLECVESGTSSLNDITVTSIGQLITDGTCKWLSLDIRDSAPVGTIKQDLVVRNGYLPLTGETKNVADYPRLVNWLVNNNLMNAYTASPESTKFYYADANNITFKLPALSNLFFQCKGDNTLKKVEAGLPNISGTLGNLKSWGRTSAPSSTDLLSWQVNQYSESNKTYETKTSSGVTMYDSLRLDASKGNSIFGKSTTVQPPAVYLRAIIKY